MEIVLIAPPCVEAATPTGGRAAGLAAAGEALLVAGLVEALAERGGRVRAIRQPVLAADAAGPDPIANLGRHGGLIAEAVAAAIAAGAAPLLAGGTCCHLPGMLGGLQSALGPTARIGLVWLDAHGDFNTPRTTPSGMLGGMPVAVSAGLCHSVWREGAGQIVPLPTDRMVLGDVRQLDPEEAALIHATDAVIAAVTPGGPGANLATAVADLAARVDHLYLHVDSDVLDAALVPNHPTVEPGGPDLESTLAALATVFATGKVRAFGVVSVNPTGREGAISLDAGLALLRAGMDRWSAGAVAR